MLANISKLWAIYKPSQEIQPIMISAILTGYLFYKLEFGGENAAERRAAEKKKRTRPQHH
ncbi:hypothetical protein L345_09803 [Ophiophagus hannah]|uniref:Uncharacterized protein n=1 Tax=Ophiophagus hannah TaxID=8665 RepID=V8NSA0_OPHHA|nr:hypothetical protein L345_09803 [Ophiophagus hannah]